MNGRQLVASRMGNGLSKEQDIRIGYLETENPYLNDLDERFYDLNKRQPLEKILIDYIQKNREKFYFKGIIEVSDFDSDKFVKDFFKVKKSK